MDGNRLGLVVLAAALVAGGCGVVNEHNDERGRGDAPVESRDDSAKEVINFPDTFSNVAHACDGHGHRVYVTTQNANGKQLAVIDDPSCG